VGHDFVTAYGNEFPHAVTKGNRQCKTTFEFQNFKIRIFQTTSDGKTPKMKIVNLKKL
jgi:hypothetical protein